MAASRLCSAAAIAAAFTSMSLSQNRAYADSRFRFPFFSSSPPAEESPTDHKSSSNSKSETKSDSDEPKGSGFDPESLERGAKALREINSSPHSKQVIMRNQQALESSFFVMFDTLLTCSCVHQVFDLMRKQEKTRLAELAAEKEHNEAIQAHKDIVSDLLLLAFSVSLLFPTSKFCCTIGCRILILQ